MSSETATHFVIAVAVVGLGLIAYAGVLKYLRERPVSPLMAFAGRERARRLTVIDAAVVDTRRRVVLIRRDNVEHLVLIGGPTDVVIETRIGAEEAVAAPVAVQRIKDMEDPAEAERPIVARRPQQARQQINPAPAPAPSQVPAAPANWDAEYAAARAEEDTYSYGPNAAFDAKDYPLQETAAYREQPAAASAPEPAKPSAAAVAEANAESIIEMLRSRILNDAAATASMQAARQQQQAEAARRPREVSTFERLLNERLQANDRAAAAAPRTQQRVPTPSAQPGVGPATARASAAAAQNIPQVRELPAEKPRSEVALEMEVARILEELQTRRRQKQTP